MIAYRVLMSCIVLIIRIKDNLNQFCEERGIDRKLRVRLRGYLRSAQHVYKDRFYQEMLQTLSPMLQGEVTMATHEEWIGTLNFLNGVDPQEKISFRCIHINQLSHVRTNCRVCTFSSASCCVLYSSRDALRKKST